MADRPILFSTPMVRALLDGRKTQTRRALKFPKKSFSGGPLYERPDMGGWEPTTNGGGRCFAFVKGQKVSVPETIGMWHRTTGMAFDAPVQRGDRLWVREAWGYDWFDDGQHRAWKTPVYRADNSAEPMDNGSPTQWRPSIHMPRQVSRLTLIVTDVRVQRLQDISEEDALAEGIIYENVIIDCHCHGGVHQEVTADRFWNSAKPDSFEGHECAGDAYADLWEKIYGSGAWQRNPWVAAYTFTVHTCNIDAMEPNHG